MAAEAHNKANAGDAIALSTVHSVCTVGGFAGCQELVEWAPLIRIPFCGLRRRG